METTIYTEVWKPSFAFQDKALASERNMEFYFRKVYWGFFFNNKTYFFCSPRAVQGIFAEELTEMLTENIIF